MKRLLLALCLLLPAGAAVAFDPAPAALRIGILRAPDRDHHTVRVIREALRDELKSRGVDAFVVEADLDQLAAAEARDADYYLEILGETDVREHGGVGVGSRHADVSLGVVSSEMVADLFVYDGATLEPIAEETLSKKNTAVLPTGVGVGGRSLFAWVALPFVERAQTRSVGRAVAKEMAARVVDAVRAR